MDDGAIRIEEISAKQTRPIRQAVLRPHQAERELVYPGDDDAGSFHLGAMRGDAVLAILSMYHQAMDDTPSGWRIRGMASAPEVRGTGYGRKLVEVARDRAWEIERAPIWCNARASAFGFYEKLGFMIVGDLFEIEGIGTHAVMVLSAEASRG